jgi:hypothetical protein
MVKDKIILLFRLTSRGEDISREFFEKIQKFGGSKRDLIILMGYKDINRSALRFLNKLIKDELIYPYCINNRGDYDYKIDFEKVRMTISKNPEFKDDYYSILGFINKEYTVLGDKWNG